MCVLSCDTTPPTQVAHLRQGRAGVAAAQRVRQHVQVPTIIIQPVPLAVHVGHLVLHPHSRDRREAGGERRMLIVVPAARGYLATLANGAGGAGAGGGTIRRARRTLAGSGRFERSRRGRSC